MPRHPYGGPVGDPYDGAGFRGHNKAASKGGPSGVSRSTAAQLKEHEPLFTTYEHLAGQDRSDAALLMLRKAASLVKPIMQKHGWRVKVLAEFLPPEQNLLGLNINKGYKICIRLRYHHNHDLFLPFDDVVDTLLHELCHNVWGPHDSNFHKLWEELRDEHEALVRKGYTGEGFLSAGKTLGGSGVRAPPPHQLRELARIQAEKRKAQGALSSGSGQRLGGTPIHLQGQDIRKVIADQAIRRKAISTGCASGSQNAIELSQQAESNAFKTKAEEDDANNLAISKALQELMEQEEEHKLGRPFDAPSNGGGLAWSAENGLYDAGPSRPTPSGRHDHPSEEEQLKWAMEDSMKYAGESSTGLHHAQAALPGRTTFFEDPDRTASPEEFERTPLPGDSGASPHDVSSTASPTPSPPKQKPEHDPLGKRKRETSRSNSSPTPAHPTKQERSVKEENTTIDLDAIPPFAKPAAAAENDWACEVCTCINPLQFLACDACGIERPQSVLLKSRTPQRKPVPPRVQREPVRDWETKPLPRNESLGWNCRCGAFMEHRWWTCSACGTLKASS